MCTEINKSIDLETHPSNENTTERVQGRTGSWGSALLYQRKKWSASKLATKTSMNILITTRIFLLVIFIMALKGSELHSPQFKVSETQSYCNIHYKIYHYRNTKYQSQVSTWINLGFHFFSSMTRSTNLSPLFFLLFNVIHDSTDTCITLTYINCPIELLTVKNEEVNK